MIDCHTAQMIELAGLYEKGLAPIVGGVLDQAAGFVTAIRFVWAENEYWEKKLKLF